MPCAPVTAPFLPPSFSIKPRLCPFVTLLRKWCSSVQPVVPEFNTTANVIKDKDSLKYRWRNIKKVYHIYEQLRTRSGWGWDDEQNLPVPPDEESIQAAITINSDYKKYIDKPFPYKRQLDILCGKTTVRGSHFMGSTQDVDVEATRSMVIREQSPSVDVDALVREILCEENALFLAIDEAIADEILESNEEHSVPRPMHTSSHTGHIWINEVLQGHEGRCYNVFRLHPTMFMRLRDELMERDLIRDSCYVKATEKLAIFMYTMGHGVASGAMCEHFQHSSETISKHVCEVTKALASLRFNYIKLPTLTDPVHLRIRHDDIFYPYFKSEERTEEEADEAQLLLRKKRKVAGLAEQEASRMPPVVRPEVAQRMATELGLIVVRDGSERSAEEQREVSAPPGPSEGREQEVARTTTSSTGGAGDDAAGIAAETFARRGEEKGTSPRREVPEKDVPEEAVASATGATPTGEMTAPQKEVVVVAAAPLPPTKMVAIVEIPSNTLALVTEGRREVSDAVAEPARRAEISNEQPDAVEEIVSSGEDRRPLSKVLKGKSSELPSQAMLEATLGRLGSDASRVLPPVPVRILSG
ncbi:hypothetical protein Taro_011490 [Colocasia esculenta]|uniref:Myb/SANT-like domain-containing protein n=1 Tax=Colocasia esculenta TaxID=4460 RepID=A0A843UAR8_COLES|nr:hypothetical protein [Colocasia esculenta]